MVEKSSKRSLPYFFIPFLYTFTGLLLLIALPSYVFTLMEGWMLLDAVYYSFISLSTIGFGDYIPSMEPPLRYATYIRNDTACFEALINPIPSQDVNTRSGLSKLCDPTVWPANIEYIFNMYRVMVFFWILAG